MADADRPVDASEIFYQRLERLQPPTLAQQQLTDDIITAIIQLSNAELASLILNLIVEIQQQKIAASLVLENHHNTLDENQRLRASSIAQRTIERAVETDGTGH